MKNAFTLQFTCQNTGIPKRRSRNASNNYHQYNKIIIIIITILNIITIIIIIIITIIVLFLCSPSVVFIVQKPVGPRKQLKQSIVVNITGLRKSTGGIKTSWLFIQQSWSRISARVYREQIGPAGRHLNSGTPECKSGTLTTRSRCLLNFSGYLKRYGAKRETESPQDGSVCHARWVTLILGLS